MIDRTKHLIKKIHPTKIVETFPEFLKDEAASGKLILGATVLALIAVNSPLRDVYEQFWHNHFSIGLATWSLSLDLRHWINEGLMASF